MTTRRPLGTWLRQNGASGAKGLKQLTAQSYITIITKRCMFRSRWGEASAPWRVEAAPLPRQLAE